MRSCARAAGARTRRTRASARQCATPLDPRRTAREERKVVTCLFCDLVGFTARAERMDPEDVRRLLQPYHARVRAELERFGGTVEKFIGDAVMAVFGAPIAHEDDPERAVRAALAIRDALAEEGELEVRIGITTGEALVALDARPEAGEGMASGRRRQHGGAAPGGRADRTGSSSTRRPIRATERAIEYGDAELRSTRRASPQPIAVWEALRGSRSRRRRASRRRAARRPRARARRSSARRSPASRSERAPQLVTLVGVRASARAGSSTSSSRRSRPERIGLVYWRHGRSLPYGEGVTFWALGEMVKAQAGILESDARRRPPRSSARPSSRLVATRPRPAGSSATSAARRARR